ncbi:hypothetical protein [Wolbachia endosymbiont (group E) of Neria commutata]|uniref:hypothetical protein n=1 Tax=Wolbachia endosymbiont (group E) of Neria commutata TaxID=3066149 RepID=UPI003132C338
MTNIIEQNSPKIFSRANSKGIVAPPVPLRSPETKLLSQSKLQGVTKPKVAPPVPPKSHQAKFAGRLAIFEQNALNKAKSEERANKTPDKQVKQSVKHHPKVEQSGNLHLGWSIPTGNGLNKLNATKKADPAATKPYVGMKLAHVLNPLKTLRERRNSVPSPSSTSSIDFEALASSAQADIDRMMMENMNAFEQNPTKSKPATIDDMLFGGMNDSTPCMEQQRSEVPSDAGNVVENSRLSTIMEVSTTAEERTQSSTATAQHPKPQKSEAVKVKEQVPLELPEQTTKFPISTQADNSLNHNPEDQGKKRFSPDRFKPRHPSQQIEQPDFTKSGFGKPVKHSSNLEKCMITHNGSKIEPEMQRNHGFKEDPTIMHVKGEFATCAITKGNGKRGVTQPNVSHEAKLPDAVLNQVKVKERIAKIENGGRSW